MKDMIDMMNNKLLQTINRPATQEQGSGGTFRVLRHSPVLTLPVLESGKGVAVFFPVRVLRSGSTLYDLPGSARRSTIKVIYDRLDGELCKN